jgi:hypothetical protein
MNPFQTPEEAVQALQKESQEAWTQFANANNIKTETDIVAYYLAKKVFMAGYMNGSKFVMTHLIKQTPKTTEPTI